MPFHTPQFPWIEINHEERRILCKRCNAIITYRAFEPHESGLELLMDNLRLFVLGMHDHRRGSRHDRLKRQRRAIKAATEGR